MRITKVYTKIGDKGTTRLVGNVEISKGHPRIESYGTVDELNSLIGVVRAFLGDPGKTPHAERLEQMLKRVQHVLFDVGSILATPPGEHMAGMPKVTEDTVSQVEGWIDECQKDLEPLKEFILPGGGKIGALLHQARTVCRRAERECVRLSESEPVDP
ncbi:MAG: cob(I)yrinic acid a,c-diamide adenosyltransferase, partial [Bacteroidetes bacterium]|nr:cob(I)yrinic acid a,c-diamide adenosyltransferase [Bacteroidota bacterium]